MVKMDAVHYLECITEHCVLGLNGFSFAQISAAMQNIFKGQLIMLLQLIVLLSAEGYTEFFL